MNETKIADMTTITAIIAVAGYIAMFTLATLANTTSEPRTALNIYTLGTVTYNIGLFFAGTLLYINYKANRNEKVLTCTLTSLLINAVNAMMLLVLGAPALQTSEILTTTIGIFFWIFIGAFLAGKFHRKEETIYD